MNAVSIRIALYALSLPVLCFALPAAAQHVEYEYRGQAYTVAIAQDRVESTVLRTVIGLPAPGRGQVVFYRPARGDAASATPLAVQEDSVPVARVPAGHFIVAEAMPGLHTYRVDGGSGVTLDVRADRTYFVRVGTGRDGNARLARSDAVGLVDAARGRHEFLR